MEVNTELKKSYEQLLSQDDFIQNIAQFTRSALETIFTQPQTMELVCPPTYILVLNNALQSNQTLSTFLSSLPQDRKSAVEAIVKQFIESREEAAVDNTFFSNLSHVKWEMSIENGRQVYEVALFTSQKEKPFKMRLSYEQLSILSFQVSQIVSTLNQKIDSRH